MLVTIEQNVSNVREMLQLFAKLLTLERCKSAQILQISISAAKRAFTAKIGFDTAENEPSKVVLLYFLIYQIST